MERERERFVVQSKFYLKSRRLCDRVAIGERRSLDYAPRALTCRYLIGDVELELGSMWRPKRAAAVRYIRTSNGRHLFISTITLCSATI